MSENPPPKRKIVGNYYPGMPLMEKKPSTLHRRFSTITTHHRPIISKFTMKVANHISEQNLKTEPKNTVCSPLLLDIVLNVIAFGSKGTTLEQLLGLIGCQDVKEFNEIVSKFVEVLEESKGDNGPDVCFGNALWVDQRYPLKKPFQKIVKELLKTEAMAVDFRNQPDEVVKEANLWVEKQSKGLIKEFISKDHLKKDTVLLLANALYFKGTWVEKFKPEDTKDQKFYLLDGKKIQVPFMNQRETEYDYGTFEGCQVLRMLYNEEEVPRGERSRSFSMYIFLPRRKDGLSDLLGKIQMDSTMFIDKIKLTYKKINLAIPKFKFECLIPLKKTMKELGLTLPFDVNSKDITEMVESPYGDWLYVDDIIQKSHMEVDEEGTKVVTLTMLSMCGGGGPPPQRPIRFVADHPFMFMIREDYSGAILFMGTILKP